MCKILNNGHGRAGTMLLAMTMKAVGRAVGAMVSVVFSGVVVKFAPVISGWLGLSK